jgi:hypothetical protein
MSLARGAKNLTSATETNTVAGDRRLKPLPHEAKGLIAQFMAYLEKEGYARETCYPSVLRNLVKLGANMLDPESVKAAIGRHNVKDGTKFSTFMRTLPSQRCLK